MSQTPPPKLFLWFFRWYCRRSLVTHIEGDLIELYHERLKKSGKRRADLLFAIDVILLLRPGIIRKSAESKTTNPVMMYRNYLTVALRNLRRNKGYSAINIGGLAIGMTVALLNGLWIWDELSFNKSFANYDRIAQITKRELDLRKGGQWIGTSMVYPLGTELIEKHSQEFEHIVRTSNDTESIFSVNENYVSSIGLYADQDAPRMFSFNMLQGTHAGLREPKSILISRSLAESLFGTSDPMNQTLRMNNRTDLEVTGIFEDFPANTRFGRLRYFLSWDLFLANNKWIEARALTDWRNHFYQIYVQLHPSGSFEASQDRIQSVLRFDPQDAEHAIKTRQHIYLHPMSEWRLYPSGSQYGDSETIRMIKLLGAIGTFVLVLACINFMNLSTARSEKRAKEVGIRKTIGSVRSQLIGQFFSESLLMVLFAFVVALVLSYTALPWFNLIAAKQIAMPWTNGWFWLSGAVFVCVTSVLAGSYPAIYLSSFTPAKTLKGLFRVGPAASIPRKVLVVFQFSISVILITGTAIVYQQIQHAKNRPVGYDREGLIMIRKKTSEFDGKYNILRTELKNTGAVVEVSESMGPMTDVVSGNNGWDWTGRDPNNDQSFATLAVSHTHGKTAGWKFIDGRDFDLARSSDSSGLIINESAARIMGLAHPVGEAVSWTWWQDKRVINYIILGVIEDLVMDSPYGKVDPTIFYLQGFNGKPGWINIRLTPGSVPAEALLKIEQVFKKVIPTVPFDYKFADEEYARKFQSEERIGELASIFAGLAIFISCLGLLGLASFVAEQRTKEVGIRKVMGASITGLWKLLSQDFVRLVIVSCAIATPLSWYLLSEWLERFEYRTHISIWIFAGTVTGTIIITLCTVSYQAIKAAMTNPAKSLRTE